MLYFYFSLLYKRILYYFVSALSQNSTLLSELDSEFENLAPFLLRYRYRPDMSQITSLIKPFYFNNTKISRETVPQLTDVCVNKYRYFYMFLCLLV